MSLQYLNRNPTNVFKINGKVPVADAVLVLTKTIVLNNTKGSYTLLEACVYDDITSAAATPSNFYTKFEFKFDKTSITSAQYSNGNKTLTSNVAGTSEVLNFANSPVPIKFLEYDNTYKLGTKVSDNALVLLLGLPSITGIGTLGDEWVIPA